MNYMNEVAQLLGVEIGEEFNIEGQPGDVRYKLTRVNLEYFYDGNWYTTQATLVYLLNGQAKVVKITKPILDEKEKEYLSYVIRPFRNRIKYICKNNNEDGDTEFLDVQLDDNDFMAFPNFKKGTMYKGMEVSKSYTPGELGL